MGKKLLVITAGTEAASVGQELEKQMHAHPTSELQVMVRYLDTAYLPNRYGSLHSQEWFQMSIDQRHILAIYQNLAEHPEIENLLFPGLLPGTDQSGGGAIRYNGAGAVEIQRDKLRKWISSSLADLAGWGQGETTISIALIISAVGATGSGSLEHLIDLVVDAANYAGVKSSTQSTVRCDVYILQPGKKHVTDLGLANTLALYAELAASQLSLQKNQTRQYQGRKIMVGWGSSFILSSIDQLKEAAASLVRLSMDTTTAFSAEYQEREVDNHVLRELDPISGLPTHLSLATAVTINTGTLVEQVIRRDTEQLIETLVLGQTDNRQPGVLLASLTRVLAGGDPGSRYGRLLAFLAENSGYGQMRENLENVLQEAGTVEGKYQNLRQYYQSYQTQLRQGQRSFLEKGQAFLSEVLEVFDRARREMISIQGFSLYELREDVRFLEYTLSQVYKVARNDTGRNHTNEGEIERLSEEVQKARFPRTKQERLRELKERMIANLFGLLQEVARDAALVVLDELERYSLSIGLKLDTVLQRQRKEKARQDARTLAQGQFVLDKSHPLHLMALDTIEQARQYSEKISILTGGQRKPAGVGRSTNEQLADFRAWLIQQSEFEALFEGESEHLAETVQSYVRQRVKEAVGQYKLIDLLLADGEERLIHKLREASGRAISLVSFAPAFAPDLREAWYVSADFRMTREDLAARESDYPEDRARRAKLEKAMKQAFTSGDCKLLTSRDPSEIALFYYVDGLPVSAIEDLKGRCLEAFLGRRKRWYQQQKALGNDSTPQASIGGLNQRVGVPVYSGRDAEQRVIETGIIKRLYDVKGTEVGSYRVEDIPELGDYQPIEQPAAALNGNTPAPTSAQTATGDPMGNSDPHAYSQGYRGSPGTQPVQEQAH